MVSAAVRLRRRSGINGILALDEDELKVLPMRSHREPTRVARKLVVLALLEAEDFGVELESLLLVSHDNRHVGCFFDHRLHLGLCI